MDSLFYITASIALAVSAVTLIVVAFDLRRLRIHFETSTISIVVQDDRPGDTHHTTVDSLSGYSIFVYRNNQWILEADLSSPGFEATPPTIPGTYDGQVVKKESVPISSV
jgi:hypothetical protein